MKIIVINLASIGDEIMRTPLTRALKQIYPGAELDMLVVPAVVPIAEMDSHVDSVLIYDKKNVDRGIKGIFAMSRKLRRGNYDLAICTNYALRGALISWLAGIKRRCGYNAQHARWFLTDVVVKHPVVQYEAKNQLRIIAPLSAGKFDSQTSLTIAAADAGYIREQLLTASNQKNIVFCPLSNFANRSLTVTKGQAILSKLCELGRVFLIGSSRQLEILTQMNSANNARLLAGTLSLKQLAALLQEADMMVSVDTGPMHMAVALGTKTVALFGASNPDFWGMNIENTTNFYGIKYPKAKAHDDNSDANCLNVLDNAEVVNCAKIMLTVDVENK